ncbi:hypothetical protein VC159_02695 [Polynucleobacter sp. JS-JIR-II-c23]|uniref:hypothetical protein n=1 Tax=Polynucleobacter sp. JS-JIR-II-c23 TaxID=1758393 RepID=UPI002B22FADE|nr:hypothetical protein [Polynucleobacter sp. JS-JIR-II-c23]MEA9603358.1 hypothetical protein [Polynucleobacter sp. JS-JIR-II-c23]QWE02174.1 hypothetical protein ICV90_08315 [Polynucleobacter sp. JS-JIR-II-b4]
MYQSNLYTENTIRLMEIVLALTGDDKCYPYQNPPYALDHEGFITLSGALKSELNKNGNQDLVAWAHQNIVSLFKEKVNCCQFRSTTKESFSIVNHCSNMG